MSRASLANLRPDTFSWLIGPSVVRSDGAVMSWLNQDRPAYSYPEIAGYMLSYLAQRGPDTRPLRNRIAAHLATELTASGAVGRGGSEYVFDSAMVLCGLLAHQRAGGLLTVPDMPERLNRFVTGRLERRVAVEASAGDDRTDWPQSFGPHLLKCVMGLTAYAEEHQQPSPRDLLQSLLDGLLPLNRDGRFVVSADSNQTYVQAHCYALEGLLVLDGRGYSGLRPWIDSGARWLAEQQNDDGGMPALVAGRFAIPTAHADCTAQAVRIWACVNPTGYDDNIDRALRFLNELHVDGAFRHRPGSAELNTWSTILSAQALEMAQNGGNWRQLI